MPPAGGLKAAKLAAERGGHAPAPLAEHSSQSSQSDSERTFIIGGAAMGAGEAARGPGAQPSKQKGKGGAGAPRPRAAGGPAAGAGAAGSHQRQVAAGLREQFAAMLADTLEAGLVCEASEVMFREIMSGGKKGGRFRGVTKHKRTQRYEAHIWSCKKQIYLGGFDSEIMAAKSHDIMALKCKETATASAASAAIGMAEVLNFAQEEYDELAPHLAAVTQEDVICALRTFSKAQAQQRMASLHRTNKGRVQKPASPKPAPLKLPHPPASGKQSPLLAPARKLSINTLASSAAAPPPAGRPPGSPLSRPLGSPTRRPARNQAAMPVTPKAEGVERGAPKTPTTCPTHVLLGPYGTLEAGAGMASPFCSPFQQSPHKRAAAAAAAAAIAGYESEAAESEAMSEGEGEGEEESSGEEYIQEEEEEEEEEGSEGESTMVAHAAAAAGRASGAARTRGRGRPARAPRRADWGAGSAASMELLFEEPSLTFSASEEGRLFEWTPMDRGHSGLEHTRTGTVLFRSPAQQAEHRRMAEEMTRQLEPLGSCALGLLAPGTLCQPAAAPLPLPGGSLPQGGDGGVGTFAEEVVVHIQQAPSITWPRPAYAWPWCV